MHRHPLRLLLLVMSLAATVQAEETPAANTRISELEHQLAASEQQRNELASQLAGSQAERGSAQTTRLLEENQRLHEALARQVQNPLNEQQTWYLVGAAAALLGVLVGALLRGKRKRRREWLN